MRKETAGKQGIIYKTLTIEEYLHTNFILLNFLEAPSSDLELGVRIS
jgi:hypothetical protein